MKTISLACLSTDTWTPLRVVTSARSVDTWSRGGGGTAARTPASQQGCSRARYLGGREPARCARPRPARAAEGGERLRGTRRGRREARRRGVESLSHRLALGLPHLTGRCPKRGGCPRLDVPQRIRRPAKVEAAEIAGVGSPGPARLQPAIDLHRRAAAPTHRRRRGPRSELLVTERASPVAEEPPAGCVCRSGRPSAAGRSSSHETWTASGRPRSTKTVVGSGSPAERRIAGH